MKTKTKTTAAGNLAHETAICPECGRAVGINAHGRIARHGANGRGTPSCLDRRMFRLFREEEAKRAEREKSGV